MNPDRFRQLQDVFHGALARPAAERETFVRESAGGDEDFVHEVMELVGAHEAETPFPETALLDEGDAPLVEGQRVGTYRVLREIGRGGMGVVYLSEDTRLNRQVALKALSQAFTPDGRQQERFRREAMLAGSLSHPAIATIYALEEVDERFYIVSEYVPGPSLRQEASAPVAFGRVLEIGLQVAGALVAAHEKGVVHRDLKPENILSVDERRLKIVDFGLALGSDPGTAGQRLTRPGFLVGTPAYMSPEQLRGEPVDFRSDLFSLGVLLYELLLGRHPFESDTLMGTTARILEAEPDGLAEVRKGAPGLSDVVLRCLEKSPKGRFGSTGDALEALENIRSGLDSGGRLRVPIRIEAQADPNGAAGLSAFWWVFHQVAVTGVYATMIVLAFILNARYPAPAVLAGAFLTMVCGIWNGATRVHLLFTLRVNRRVLEREVSRTRRVTWPIDLAFSLLLVAIGVAVLPSSQPWAVAMAAVGAGYGAVFSIVEPTTIRSVFPDAV